jgi:pimeloyl-ACP methyl ester carboxylesterase
VLGNVPKSERLALVEESFRTMPERYLGAEPGFDTTYHLLLADVGHTWEVRCTTHGARVRKGLTTRRPDVEIGTDSATWLRLRQGELSGIDAFSERKLYVRGNLDHAVGRQRVSTLTMGEGPDVILMHGLGATKASFFDMAAALSKDHRVHAIDLPGFGSSSKPALAPYNVRWYASTVARLMDVLGIERAHLVGNSMGGRVALELGLSRPERIGGIVGLAPAVAWLRRDFHRVVRLLRPEVGLLPHRFTETMVRNQFWDLFADPDLLDPAMVDVIVSEFQRIYGSPGARLAFLSMARNIYLESPFGAHGFYPRLSELRPPALFVWGSHDRLVPAAFSSHVAQWLPSAEQIVLEGCGHVPQVEREEQTNGIVRRFFSSVDALGWPRRRIAAA